MRTRKKWLVPALAALVVAGFAACGDDDGGSNVTPPPPPPPAPPPPPPPPGDGDPFRVSAWFAGSAAQPPLANRSDVTVALDARGFPTAATPTLTGFPFDPPATFNGHAVPDYVVPTSYVGAIDPAGGADWTDGWTVAINGNEAVWDAAGATPTGDDSCPEGTTDVGDFSDRFGPLAQDEAGLVGGGDIDICQLAQRYTTDLVLTNDNVYELATGFPGTFFGTGDDTDAANDVAVTVTIEAGTLIFGEPQEAFVVTRGARIQANGTATDPIVFTSATQLAARFDGDPATAVDTGRGEWAGLALMGRARSNECGASFASCNVEAEGNIGSYGGDADDDSSGSLEYVVVRHAGNDIDGQGNELNGITYFATGSGTRSNFVQVHRGLDDGIEHFGAADFVGHAVLTENADDSLDWGQGWTGGAQFVLVVQAADEGGHGIEADNDATNNDAAPISLPLVANATFVGRGADSDTGFNLRRGTGAQLWNVIVTGFDPGCIDLNDDATFARAGAGAPDAPGDGLVARNSIVDCAVDFVEE